MYVSVICCFSFSLNNRTAELSLQPLNDSLKVRVGNTKVLTIQGWWPKFNSEITHKDERIKPIPQSCPLSSTNVPSNMCTTPHNVLMHTQTILIIEKVQACVLLEFNVHANPMFPLTFLLLTSDKWERSKEMEVSYDEDMKVHAGGGWWGMH